MVATIVLRLQEKSLANFVYETPALEREKIADLSVADNSAPSVRIAKNAIKIRWVERL